jgi:hypothetical protein
MNAHDSFEEKLYNHFKENREVPQKITEAIFETKLKKDKKNIFNFYNLGKAAIVALSVVTISTGIVFAKDISQFVKKIFKDSTGVDTAVQNGYVHEIPTTYSESKDTKIEFTEMIMDDYTLDLKMIAQLDENMDVTGIENFYIPDMLITDDKNNILYCKNQEIIKNYCNEKNINYDYETIKNITTNTASSIFMYSVDKNSIVFGCNLSASEEKFPRSKEIYISLNTIEAKGNNKNYIVTGKWESKITVPSKFYNRESQIYKVVSYNNANIYKDSIKAEVYETGMKFEMGMYWGDFETVSAKVDEIRKTNVLASQLIKQEASYVENENGDKFYPAQSSEADGGYSFNVDGTLFKWETFNLTKFDATDKLKVVLMTIDNEEIIIELQK